MAFPKGRWEEEWATVEHLNPQKHDACNKQPFVVNQYAVTLNFHYFIYDN